VVCTANHTVRHFELYLNSLEFSKEFCNTMKIDPNDLITQTEAARIRGVTHEAIRYLVRKGRFTVIKVGGRVFLSRSEVEAFKPSVGGRPKANPTKKAPQKTKAARKRGSRKSKRTARLKGQ